MNSTEAIRNYKHDIAGKFKDISSALSALDEHSFENPETHEIFHAVHEVILKMVKTSRNTILNHLSQDNLLIVTDAAPDLSLPKLQIEGVVVRYSGQDGTVTYFYSRQENENNEEVKLQAIKSLLPINQIIFEANV